MQRELARKSVTRHISDFNANHVGVGCHRIKITTVSHSCGKDLIMESTQQQQATAYGVLMTQRELPKCPTCGAVPEWRWKVNSQGSSFATLKCPYGHHKTHRTYQVGAESLASENLIKQWNELVSGVNGNV